MIAPRTGPPLGLPELAAALAELRAEIDASRTARVGEVSTVHPAHREGAINLGDYVALRQHDLREIQGALADLGLSSLGRAEARVSETLSRVRAAVHALAGTEPALPRAQDPLDRNTDALFGPARANRRVRIMVTASAELADQPETLRSLVAEGMDVLRINCAHDSAPIWHRLVDLTRAACKVTSRGCRILVDLSGPKLRTGDLQPGPQIVSWHPQRDERGLVPVAVRIWLGTGPPPCPTDVSLPVEEGHGLAHLAVGSQLRIRDARGRKRDLEVIEVARAGVVVTSDRSAWVEAGAQLTRVHHPHVVVARIAELPALPGVLVLSVGDELELTRDPAPGRPAEGLRLATVPCTLPEVFGAVREGAPILFDDGRIAGVVVAASPDTLRVRVTRARAGGSKLRAAKGINLPDTDLPVRALTAFDLECLDQIASVVDMVGMSFVRRPEDVRQLRDELAARGAADVGLVLKIETRAGFENLPALLMEALHSARVGVMVARGDLAVECGFERLAELQEEILWVCEAAHVPAIWATQVLDTLTRTGVVTRAEITDAAVGQRAECVMLNKGPYAVEAVRALADILERMAGHQRKKTAMLRQLRSIGLADPPSSGDSSR